MSRRRVKGLGTYVYLVESPHLISVRLNMSCWPRINFADRYTSTVEAGADDISAFQRSGELPDALDPAIIAKLLTALVDGLQLRLLYEPETALLRPVRSSGSPARSPR